ncbi:hypothetical protein M5D96_004321 [Drosophila gunungcola]|uniref:trypsin n=2 Tax=Drosophila gunungcola TaxID=103775 RepID=A0A9Q0BSI7_9MUSC|nr:hypothetical protein M5D96_004321 [Drosophila gunungcola]
MFIEWIFVISSVLLASAGWISERIVGGYQVPISEVPWQAAFLLNGTADCGAVIYSDKILITAAHCIQNQNKSDISIRVGSSTWNNGGQLLQVDDAEVHEDYSFTKDVVINDIAVIRVKGHLKMGHSVQSIPLAESTPASGSSATVSGWGAVGYSQEVSEHLLQTTVNIVSQEDCQKSYGEGITKSMICAAAQGKDSCSQDSGGPLVSDGQLIGIVSFGTSCADPNYPGVYVNVAELKPWILRAIEKLSCLCAGKV